MLSKLSVKKPLTVVAIVIIILVLGVISYQSTTIDMLPNLDLPYVIIATIYGGAAPELIEKEVTTPLEQAIAKVSGINKLMSISRESASLIICELGYKSDVGNVMGDIGRAVALVALPDSPALFDPMVMQFSINEAPIMYLSMSRDGYEIEESSAYFNNIINKLDGVSGVAKASPSGLISNLALINLNAQSTTDSILTFITNLLGIQLALPDAVKDQVRGDLAVLLADAKGNPDLITNDKLDTEKVLDNLIIPYIQDQIAASTDANTIWDRLGEELSKPDSQARVIMLRYLQVILDSSYILQDGEDNEAIFNTLLDTALQEVVKSIISYYTGSLTGMVSDSLLQQVIFAQDFTMPAGSIDIGAGSYIVKVGDRITSRDELYNMPVVSLDLSSNIKDYVKSLQTVLSLLSMASSDGKVAFTSEDMQSLSQAVAATFQRVEDYGVWAVDTITTSQKDSYLNMDAAARTAWAQLINADSGFAALAAGYTSARPFNWRTTLLKYISDHQLFLSEGTQIAPAVYWGSSHTAYYTAEVEAQILAASEALPQSYQQYADYIIDTATSSLDNLFFQLSEQDKLYWRNYLQNDTHFRTAADNMTTDKDWRKTIIKCVRDYDIFPQDFSGNGWTSGKVAYYKEVLRVRQGLLDIGRPTSPQAYAAYAVNALIPINPQDDYFLSLDQRQQWAQQVSEDTGFIAAANGITATDNWQKAIFTYISLHLDTLLPLGMQIVSPKVWGETAESIYSARIDYLLLSYQPSDRLATLLEANLDAQQMQVLNTLFADRTADDVMGMLEFLLSLLQTYGGEGAVVTQYDEVTGVTAYTIDFVAIYATLDAVKDTLTLQMCLKDLGMLSFFNDGTSQVVSIMQRVDGNLVASPSVMLQIEKTPDSSTYDVIKAVKAVLKSQQKSDKAFSYIITYDDSEMIDFMANAVVSNFAIGGLLAAVVLLLFLRSIKATIAISLSIIISVFTAFVLMHFSGVTLNVMSMGGLVIGVGMLVDNSVVVLENIVRLRLQGKDIYRASIQGAKQVGGAILGSTITTIIVFLPILFIQGLTTMFIKDLALTICYSLVASLFVAITLVPAFTSTMMKKPAKADSKMSIRTKKVYAKVLTAALNHKLIGIIVVTALFGVSVLAALSLNITMFPDITVSNITIVCQVDSEAIDQKNVGLDISDPNYYTFERAIKDASDNMIATFANYSDIDYVGIGMSAGMKIANIDVTASRSIKADIVLVDGKKRTMERLDLRNSIINSINASSNGTYKAVIGDSNLYDQFMSMLGDAYTIKIYGSDIDTMRQEAQQLADYLATADQIASATTDSGTLEQEYKLSINKDVANSYGLTVAEVYLQVSEALKKPQAIQTLRIEDNNRKKDVDVYIYGDNYTNLSWYTANDSGNTRIYFYNNTEAAAAYYTINTGRNAIVVKAGDSIHFVASGGKIPLIKDGNSFSYLLSTTDTEGVATFVPKTLSVDNTKEYYSIRRKDIDLVTLGIKSGDPLGSGTATVIVPLYKLLNADSFVTDEGGGILYRSSITNTESIPVGIKLTDGYSSINHEDGRKVVSISLEFKGSLSDQQKADAVDKAVAAYKASYDISDDVLIVTQQDPTIMGDIYDTLIKVLIIALGLIYLVMLAQFQNLKHPLIIMTTIPIAFTGSFFALWLTGTDLGIVPIIGLIVLVGVVVNNGIVFVDYVNNLIRSGEPLRQAVIRAGIDRLRPILMTSLTTIVALLITALDSSMGNVMLQPLALTTVGGLVYATFVTLFFVPVIYELFNRKAKQTNKDIIMKAKDIDKIDQDDMGTDELDESLGSYVHTLASKKRVSALSRLFGNRQAALTAADQSELSYATQSATVQSEGQLTPYQSEIYTPTPSDTPMQTTSTYPAQSEMPTSSQPLYAQSDNSQALSTQSAIRRTEADASTSNMVTRQITPKPNTSPYFAPFAPKKDRASTQKGSRKPK